MPRLSHCLFSSLVVVTSVAHAQEIAVVRDLDAGGKVTLTKDDLGRLLPDARMSRLTGKGNTQIWKNDADGSFVISSDNRDVQGQNSTAQGKWHISEDGRYCVLIEWKKNPTEEWCRYILKAGNEYYATRSDKTGTERVYKLGIAK
jgi:Protein of unknown function (DUF995)